MHVESVEGPWHDAHAVEQHDELPLSGSAERGANIRSRPVSAAVALKVDARLENLYRLAHVSDAELAHLLGRDDAHVRALCSKLCREPAARTVVEPPLDDQFLGIRIALLAGRCAGEHYAAEPKAEAEGRTAHERSWHEKISCLLRYSSKAGRRLLRGGDVLRRGADVCPSPLT